MNVTELLDKSVPRSRESCADLASLIIHYGIYNPDKPYNIYRYSIYSYRYTEFRGILDDMITIICYELFVDTLLSCGIDLSEHPCYIENEIYELQEVGVLCVEEVYEVIEYIIEDLRKCIDNNIKTDHATARLVLFLDAMANYTDIHSVISKIYMVLYSNTRFKKMNSNKFLSEYADVIPVMDLESEDESLRTDLIFEYISSELKHLDIFPFTYYEFHNILQPNVGSVDISAHTSIENIYKRLLSGEDIEMSEEPIVDLYENGVKKIRIMNNDEEEYEF